MSEDVVLSGELAVTEDVVEAEPEDRIDEIEEEGGGGDDDDDIDEEVGTVEEEEEGNGVEEIEEEALEEEHEEELEEEATDKAQEVEEGKACEDDAVPIPAPLGRLRARRPAVVAPVEEPTAAAGSSGGGGKTGSRGRPRGERYENTVKRMETEAYRSLLRVLRAQGELTHDKETALEALRQILHVSDQEHRSEARAVAADRELEAVARKKLGVLCTPWVVPEPERRCSFSAFPSPSPSPSP
ncbi:MAG: hypothetical protein Q8P67_13490, partial [archaeon]|nr:hypothetical protein [archaeon]